MVQQNASDAELLVESKQLVSALAEHLKQPLLYARQAAELAKVKPATFNPEALQATADMGLLLVEHYQTWQRYALYQPQATQIGLTAVMHHVTEQLRHIAKEHQIALQLRIPGRYAPVLSDRALLASGLSALGLAFIEAAQQKENAEVVFGVHKSRWGLVAGVYSKDVSIRSDAFRRQQKIKGTARQLLPTSSHSPMSGVAVANALFSKLAVRLRPSQHKGMDGLAVTLTPSPQLALL